MCIRDRLVETIRQYEKTRKLLAENHELLGESDEEIRAMAREEIPALEEEISSLEERLKILLLPKDPNDYKNVFLEIRAGTGGDEAGLFAGDLFRMYARYAEQQGWRVEIVSSSPAGGMGGFKEIIAQIDGRGAYIRLKYESGVHRVQRVPVTEAQGRIHTSAVTVAILPEAEDVEVNIDPNDLRIDVYRSTGHGGQSVNTTDSAVRITHLPTGIVVSCQNEKSQLQNKVSAMRVLQAKLLERKRQEERAEMDALKGDGGSSWGNQMRSYVLHPYQMVKDLRPDYEVGNPAAVLAGDIDGFLACLL